MMHSHSTGEVRHRQPCAGHVWTQGCADREVQRVANGVRHDMRDAAHGLLTSRGNAIRRLTRTALCSACLGVRFQQIQRYVDDHVFLSADHPETSTGHVFPFTE